MSQVRFGEQLLVLLLESLSGALPDCAGVGLSLCRPEAGTAGHSAAGVGVAPALDAAQWQAGEGPLVEAAGADGPVRCDDLATDPRWAGLNRPPDCAGLAVLAVPGGWDDTGPVVLSVYLGLPAGPAELAVVERYEPLLATGLGVVEYCTDELVRADEIISMMQRRRLIEQAKGVVMGRAGLDADGAFALLVRVSQQQNVKLRRLADALLAQVTGTPVEDRRAGEVAEQLWRGLGAGVS
jgi:hypothetical protein